MTRERRNLRCTAAAVIGMLLVGAPLAEAGVTVVSVARGGGSEYFSTGIGGSDLSGLSYSKDTVTRLEVSRGGRAEKVVPVGDVTLWAAGRRAERDTGYAGRGNRGGLRCANVEVAPGEGGVWLVGGTVATAASPAVAVDRGTARYATASHVTAPAGQGASAYLVSWEDQLVGRSELGHNRFVTDVRSAAAVTDPLLIPLPPAASSGLVGLGCLAGFRIIQSARRRLRGVW